MNSIRTVVINEASFNKMIIDFLRKNGVKIHDNEALSLSFNNGKVQEKCLFTSMMVSWKEKL